MEDLSKKLIQLQDLIKAIKSMKASTQPSGIKGPTLPALPSHKAPPQPSMTPSTASAPKISSGEGPNSKKDPKKVAQQIKDGSMTTKTQKVLLKADDSVAKADAEAETKKYHIHQGPHQITSEPVTLDQVRQQHGSVQKLENSGFRLIPHEPKPTSIKKGDAQERLLTPVPPASV
jgi:hypothetical protein